MKKRIAIDNWIWGLPMIVLLLGTHIFMTLRTGFIQRKTEAEIVEEMREEKQKQFKETKSGFDSLTRAISLFEGHKEFVVIRLYYFGEDINGNPREGGTATWEEIAEELSDAGILKEIKTARRWRNKIVNDMAVCVFGIPAAVSAATYRKAVDK